jgi:peptide/nickel transport system ATP-binding protein
MLLDAIPDLELTGRRRTPVAGEVPNPIVPPSGCHFHPRCPWAEERCRREAPKSLALPAADGEPRGEVACHAVEEGRLPADAAAAPGGA